MRPLALALALPLTGCGVLLRAEAGPTWIGGDGAHATAQLTAGLPIIAGHGIYDALTVGGYVTGRPGTFDSAGVVFGCQFGVTPGGVDQPRGPKTRDGVTVVGQFQPRVGTAGMDFGGAVAVGWGSGRKTGENRWGSGGGKYALSVDWFDWRYVSWTAGVGVARRLPDDTFETPGPWRLDVPFGVELLHVTD